MGKADATVRSSNPTERVTVTGGDEEFVSGAEVARRAERELEDKDWLEWFPIVKLGATYRF